MGKVTRKGATRLLWLLKETEKEKSGELITYISQLEQSEDKCYQLFKRYAQQLGFDINVENEYDEFTLTKTDDSLEP